MWGLRNHTGLHFVFLGIVGHRQAQLPIEAGLVFGFGIDGQPRQVPGSLEQGSDLVPGDARAARGSLYLPFQAGAFLFDVVDPAGDLHRVGPGLKRGAVAREFGLAIGDLGLGANRCGVGRRLLGAVDVGDRLFDAVRRQDLGQPGVDERGDLVFTDEDIARVLDLVGQRVLLGVAAPEVDLLLVGVGLHLAVAEPAVHDAAK